MPFIVLDATTAAAAPTTSLGAPLTNVGETLSSIRGELQSDLANRLDVSTTRLNRWINWGYLNLCSMITISELSGSLALSLVNAQPFYALPTVVSWIKWIGLQDTVDYPNSDGQGFYKIDEAAYRALPDSSLVMGPPEAYFRYARMVVLYPTPLMSYVAAMDFQIRPLPMVSDTDSPILPQEFHEVILLMAKHRAWRDLRNKVDAQIAMNDALTALRPLTNTDAMEMLFTPSRMQPVRSRHDLNRRR